MKAKSHIYYRRVVTDFYWSIIKRVNRLAYLHHLVDNSDDPLLEFEDEIDEILATETRTWTKRGFRVHISVADIPLPEGEKSHWGEGNYGRFVNWNTLRKFKTMVEDAEYERAKRKREGREMWVKYFTAIAATVGALGGLATLLNLYLTYRQTRR